MATLEAHPGDNTPYAYSGPPALRQPLEDALRRVVDPEMALTIVDVGLVYAVTVDDVLAQVTMTMTSAACPVTDVIVADVETELDRALPPQLKIHVELVWEPAWTPERMSARAKAFMGW
jgi:metal-sulfur cluster biosynthetic enzyme